MQIPYGLVDSESDIAFIGSGYGGIDVLDLQDGQLLAHSDTLLIPVLMDEGAMVAVATETTGNFLHIAKTRFASGVFEILWRTEIQLPLSVSIVVGDTTLFSLVAALHDGQIDLSWEVHSRYAGGAPPSERIEAEAVYDIYGVIHLDRSNGELLAQRSSSVSNMTPPDLDPGERVMPYRYHGSWVTSTWQNTANSARQWLLKSEAGIRAVVQIDSNKKYFDVANDSSAQTIVTATGEQILLCEPQRQMDLWRVLDAGSGTEIGALELQAGVKDAAVIDGNRLLYLVQENEGNHRQWLRCQGFGQNVPLWSYLITEQELRAQPPPLPR